MTRPSATVIFFALLFLFLGLLILPSFSNPPHVDYWEAFFTFHQVRADPELTVWPYIVNHDPWRHGTFRPLSYTILYLQHLVFGGRFVFNHVTNFAFYCILLLLLFGLGRRLGGRPLETGAVIAVYAVLYSHCDVLSLNFHVFLLAGFSAFLGGVTLYLRYLEEGRARILAAVGLLFLFALFTYETFIFWPPAVLILLAADRRRRGILPTAALLGAVYTLYATVFFLTRAAAHTSGELPAASLSSLPDALVFSLFNVLYTGVGVNFYPRLAQPSSYQRYSEMLGAIPVTPPPWLTPLACGAAAAVLVLTGVVAFLLFRKGERRPLASSVFLGYLYLSNFTVLAAARSTTTDISHILRQFRYQLIPSGLLLILVAVISSALFRAARRPRAILLVILAAAFLANSFYTRRHIENAARHLTPLRELLENIRRGIDRGEITPERRLYLSDWFSRSFHPLSWNRGLGRRMYGTYQWAFSPDELYSFSLHPGDAYWTMDPERGVYVKR